MPLGPDAGLSSGALCALELGQASRTPARFARRLLKRVVFDMYNDLFELLLLFFFVCFSANWGSVFVKFGAVRLNGG